ncbi:MAG: hypothetical protein F4086_20255 [Gemmatimonadetes bacterium]|nr:hypothetical protein [Gemmatimonadota bacterium]MYJ12640.1 hypothetical protein [Gemmatimonadota bacterium]
MAESPYREWSVRYLDDRDAPAKVFDEVAARYGRKLPAAERADFRNRLRNDFAVLVVQEGLEHTTFEPDPTGRAFRVSRFLRDDYERDLTRTAENLLNGAHSMKSPKRKRLKRPRTVPRAIARKTDREIMEACFPKRVMDETDRVLDTHRATAGNAPE